MNAWVKRLFRRPPRTARPNRPKARLGVESLDARDLMSAGAASTLNLAALAPSAVVNLSTAATVPLITSPSVITNPSILVNPLYSTLPVLHSNPGAPRTLHLNFTGTTVNEDYFNTKGVNLKGIAVRGFDTDGNSSSFSASEQAMIREIWEAVAEDFAPFNIDVTTSHVGGYSDNVSVNVAIGATTKDADLTSGLAQTGGFTSAASNTALVVTSNIQKYGNLNSAAVATTASHEAGHLFGLLHDHNLSATGDAYEYDVGTDDWTPIMGENQSSDRTTWSNAEVNEVTLPGGAKTPVFQDELSVLQGVLGLRADDHTDGLFLTQLAGDAVRVTAAGTIGTMDDADRFLFRPRYSGSYSIHVGVGRFANLDARLQVYEANGTLLADVDPGSALDGQQSLSLKAGRDYTIRVSSHGTYGDLGQYTVGARLVLTAPAAQTADLPADLALAAQVDFDRGLYTTGNDWFNYHGKNEKWLMGTAGWYFITPDGNLYRWDGSATGELVATLNASFHADPSKLYNAETAVRAWGLDKLLGLYQTGDEWLNYHGKNEKWVMGTTGWFYITPDGSLYNGTSGIRLATLDASYWANTSKLTSAFA